MVKVTLLNAQAECIGDLPIPEFLQMPVVIIWGLRVFVQIDQTTNYQEAFAYVAPIKPSFL